jgi:hypothetical protein
VDKDDTFVNVYDLSGIKLLTYKLLPGNFHAVDINDLSTGIYYVNIKGVNSDSTTAKFLKVK